MLISASGHPDRGEEDPALQAGESGHVRVGNPGAVDLAAGLRAAQHPLSQFGESDSEEQRSLAGSPGNDASRSTASFR